jgi:hypothetical protein
VSRRRFQLIEIVERGYPVARIMDTIAGREHWVREFNRTYVHWDRLDQPVEHYLLRKEARTALNLRRQEKERERYREKVAT